MAELKYNDIKNNKEIRTYLHMGDMFLSTLGYTEHSVAHSEIVSQTAGKILQNLGYADKEVNLGLIAGYLHDLGNMVCRTQHALSGAALAFNILTRLDMDYEDIAYVIGAIGNHDESEGNPVSAISAAVIIADKSDVRRSRVRDVSTVETDIYDRVNYAITKSCLLVDEATRTLTLELELDTDICSILDYFEISMSRMLLCKRSANFLDASFGIVINNLRLL